MWLRASKAPRREGGRAAGARPPLLTAHLQPVHQGHFPCRDWPLGVEKLGGPLPQLPMTRCRHQGSAWCPVTQSGPRDCQSWPEPGKNGLAPPAREALWLWSRLESENKKLPMLPSPPSPGVWPVSPAGLGSTGLAWLAGQVGGGQDGHGEQWFRASRPRGGSHGQILSK